MNLLHLLPSELLLKIFQYLPYRDLNSLVLVSRRFRHLAGDPLLWRNFHFQLNSKLCQEAAQLDRVLRVRRLSKISHTLVWGYGMTGDDAHTVINSLRKKKSVSHIRFTNINLSQIDRQILSSFIVRLTAVILDLNYLSSDQTTSIFEKLCGVTAPPRCSLKHLDLCYNSVLGLPPPLLARSLARLSSLRLIQVQISELQLEAVMTALAGRHSLEALEVQGVCLASLTTHLFSSALTNLRTVVIHNTFGYNLTTQQLGQLALQAVNNKHSKLRNFTLVLGDLTELDIPTLENFLRTDVKVRLADCSLTEDQYQHFNSKEGIHINNFGCETSFNLNNFQQLY